MFIIYIFNIKRYLVYELFKVKDILLYYRIFLIYRYLEIKLGFNIDIFMYIIYYFEEKLIKFYYYEDRKREFNFSLG